MARLILDVCVFDEIEEGQTMSPSGIVYSSDRGKMCPSCGSPVAACSCRKRKSPAVQADGVVRVARETKGRKGKGVTVITGVPLGASELKALAKSLKAKCGSGGTVKNGVIEIQGDHRDRVVEELREYNWVVKRSGG